MSNRFRLEDIPYEKLSKIGITQQMMESLPQQVLDLILSGYYSPLLELRAKSGEKEFVYHTRLRLVQNSNGGVDVLFAYGSNRPNLSLLDDSEKKRLMSGEILHRRIPIQYIDVDGQLISKQELLFLQLEPSTNSILAVPTSNVTKNIKTFSDEFGLSKEENEKILSGKILTFDTHEGEITVGMDLLSDCQLFYCEGGESDWKKFRNQEIEKYSFSSDGCWVNKNGAMSYVEDRDYDDDMRSYQRASGKVNNFDMENEYEEQQEYEKTEQIKI